ncbi:hypothetical protein C5471_15280 [Photorhabdus tasmaniensis]|uniref:Uncharacterized protein n=2 Tax=Morganellaceae TaxID=1903414 RepID=A0ABX0GLA9_9GAMM|nr:hypothetical protein [Photorhabdus tasmaniensis]
MKTMNRTPEFRELTLDVQWLYTIYNEFLDEGNIEQWPNFFVKDSHYRITSRENFDQNFPLSFVLCDGQKMIKDRAIALQKTVMYRRRSQCRIVSGVRLISIDDVNVYGIKACSSFAIYESLYGESSKLLVCGRSHDVIVQDDGILKFKDRMCIINTDIIPDSIVLPI